MLEDRPEGCTPLPLSWGIRGGCRVVCSFADSHFPSVHRGRLYYFFRVADDTLDNAGALAIFSLCGSYAADQSQPSKDRKMTATVEHNVIHRNTGNIVGIIESAWDSSMPGQFTLDGFPAGSVLVRRVVYGMVPAGIVRNFDGTQRRGDDFAARAYAVSPRFAH